MSRAVLVAAQVHLNRGVHIQYHDQLEISLDCARCQRTRRTVVIRQAEHTAICTPTKHAFPAQIVARHISHAASPKLHLLVHYDYQPFVDTKYQSTSTGLIA